MSAARLTCANGWRRACAPATPSTPAPRGSNFLSTALRPGQAAHLSAPRRNGGVPARARPATPIGASRMAVGPAPHSPPPSMPSWTVCKSELKVIEKTGFISYFLIMGDFVRYGRSKGVTCVARGSAAGSIVTYLLEISNVDPIRYGLLFERFLNPERVNPPDIDIDFADDRRGDVIEYVRAKIRARLGGADHHLRHHGGQVGHPRRRPGHGLELRRMRPPGQNDSQRVEDDAEKGAGNSRPNSSRPTRTRTRPANWSTPPSSWRT